MQSIDAQRVRDSAFTWGLWKVLDYLLDRCRKTYGAAAAQAIDPAEFAAACRQLADTASPVMRALARLWAERDAAGNPGAVLAACCAGLSAAEALVVAVVTSYAACSSA